MTDWLVNVNFFKSVPGTELALRHAAFPRLRDWMNEVECRHSYILPWALVLGLFLLPSSPQASPSLRGGSTTRLALLPAQVFSGRCRFREYSQTEKFKWGAAGRGVNGSPVAEGEVLPRWWASCLALWPVLALGFSVPAGSGDRMKGLSSLHPGGSRTPASLTFLHLVS